MSSPQHDLDKALVSKAIESVLLNSGDNAYDSIVKKLNKNNLFIPDCFENPEYFAHILKEEYGEAHIQIIYAIHTRLGDASSGEQISNFLVKILQEKRQFLKEDQEITSSIIVLAIEQALLKMGSPELNKVESKLMSEFNYKLSDCVSNPTPLKKVLCELFGNCYEDIYQSVTNSLIVTSMNESSAKFLILMKA